MTKLSRWPIQQKSTQKNWRLSPPKRASRPILLLLYAGSALFIAACTRSSLPNGEGLFIAPTVVEGSVPLILETFTPLPATATPPCENNMVFLQDLTIPDGTAVKPGELIEKTWQVRNDGSCTWSRGYSIRLENGNPLGILLRHPLPSAQATEPVELSVQFTAPDDAGSYRSAWRAHDFGGEPFGVLIYIEIVVTE